MKYIYSLCSILLIFATAYSFETSFLLADNPEKTVFLSGELDINTLSIADFSNGIDSMLYSGFNTSIDYRALFPFGIEIKTGYDAGLSALSGGIAYNYTNLFWPISSRSEILYVYRKNGTDMHEFFTKEIVMAGILDFFKIYYEIIYSTGSSDGGMTAGAIISMPFDLMYFEKLSVLFESQFYSYDAGSLNRFIAGIALTTWGHQFSVFTANFNTSFPYQYTGPSDHYFVGMNIKRKFEF